MNKSELIAAITNITNSSKVDGEKFLNAFQEVVTEAMKQGDKIALTGFLSIETQHKKASTGRNPRTGEEIQIAAKNVVKIKPGKQLSDAVN
jgi:DNA-binding protein HU-beta